MKKNLAWLGFRRFTPECCNCVYHNTKHFVKCQAQGDNECKKVYGTNECYNIWSYE